MVPDKKESCASTSIVTTSGDSSPGATAVHVELECQWQHQAADEEEQDKSVALGQMDQE